MEDQKNTNPNRYQRELGQKLNRLLRCKVLAVVLALGLLSGLGTMLLIWALMGEMTPFAIPLIFAATVSVPVFYMSFSIFWVMIRHWRVVLASMKVPQNRVHPLLDRDNDLTPK